MTGDDTRREVQGRGLSPEMRAQIDELPDEGFICVDGKHKRYIVSVGEAKDWSLSHTLHKEVADTEIDKSIPAALSGPWLLAQTIVDEETAKAWLQ